MFAPRFHRHFARLALVAMLLLALAPTVNRLLLTSASAGSWVELCTRSGLAWVKLPNGEGTPVPASVDGMSHDCDYCPLINAMTALVLTVFALFPRARALAVTALRSQSRTTPARPGGLGSRGPPAFY
jgi:hypothetical protein